MDIPIQHISDPILKAMKRGTTRKQIQGLLDRCRERIPSVSLRTTVMVGFPGETVANFRELKQFVLANPFDHLGVFAYSAEPDTASVLLPGRVSRQAASMRLRSLMLQQQEVSRSRNALRVGTTCELLVTGPSGEHEWVFCGRTPWQAPDADGLTYLDSPEPVLPGLHRVRIVDSSDYDLVAAPEVQGE
jgi:ribosomal protein S12 methylthiotransferase